MKQFFKFFFASFLGSALLLLIIVILMLSILASTINRNINPSITVKPQTVLYMKLNYQIPDRTHINSFGLSLNGMNLSLNRDDIAGMNDILNNIKVAANDPNISGILLELSSIGTSSAYIQEIRNQLIEFKKSGKFVISYADEYAQNAYYLGSVADEIYLNPDGMLNIHGIASQLMFYKHLLDKLDIDVQIVRGPNNKFKSAVEPFYLDKMSEANREQTNVLLNSIWDEITKGISNARDIKVEQINKFADNLTLLFDARQALENKFVDGLIYKDELLNKLHKATNTADSKKINIIQNIQYAKIRPQKSSSSDKIAIVYASGQIFEGKGDNAKIGSETLSKAIREARNDNKVKAIVMRVNSPGGSVLASEVICREVELAAKEKPFIISMGNYAASGGYWISTNADYIFADPTTLTGSIGVFGTVPNLKNFLNKKLGLTFDLVRTNTNSDFGNLTEPMSLYQLGIMQKFVDKTYDEFTDLVARTRNLRKSYVDSIGQGRVWSGVDAIKLGLVDELGGIDKAIAYAAEKAKLTKYSIKEYPKQKEFINTILGKETQEYYAKSLLSKKLGNKYSYIEILEKVNEIEGIQALMPFYLTLE